MDDNARPEEEKSALAVLTARVDRLDRWRIVEVVSFILLASAAIATLMIQLWPEGTPDGILKTKQLIKAEAIAVLEGDIDLALSIYAQDAVVRDARGEIGQTQGLAPLDVAASWHGLAEIRKRYETLENFSELAHIDITVTLGEEGRFASARASTTGKMLLDDGTTVPISSIDGEEWRFEKIDGEWKVTSFTYNAR